LVENTIQTHAVWWRGWERPRRDTFDAAVAADDDAGVPDVGDLHQEVPDRGPRLPSVLRGEGVLGGEIRGDRKSRGAQGGYVNNYESVNCAYSCSKWPEDSQWVADGSYNNTPNNTRTKKSEKDCWVVTKGCTLEPEPSPPLGGGGAKAAWGGGCCPRWIGILGAVRVGRRDEVAGGRRGASARRADGMTSIGSTLPPRRQQERHTKVQPTQSKPQM